VAHSTGGVIIRYALDRVQHHDSAFPPYLYVPVVITMGTPHGGITSPFGAYFACTQVAHVDQNCLQGAELEGAGPDTARAPNGNTSQDFLSTLEAETSPPSGGTTYTEWTVIGSVCDGIIPATSATNIPGGPAGAHGTHKIVYTYVPDDAGVSYPFCDTFNGLNAYEHSDQQFDYLHDMAATSHQDASAVYCDGCSGTLSYPPGTLTQIHHSLAVMYLNLRLDVAPPPTPTPTPVTTCASTTETDDNERASYLDNRGNDWHVYVDLKRDSTTGAACQMQVVVRIFPPAPDGTWKGKLGVMSYNGSNLVSGSAGTVSSSTSAPGHLVWRGPWFNVSPGNTYSAKTVEYNGSNSYLRARGYIGL
jgi:hypothetical protein